MKQILSLLLLIAVYLLVSLRYYPGQATKTAIETLWHVLSISPYTAGTTVVIAMVLRRLSEGKKLQWQLLVRIFITLSIILEIFLGINNYLESGGRNQPAAETGRPHNDGAADARKQTVS